MRIALIAMSGVRVQDAELMKLGLALPGFVERSEVIASLPSLSIILSAQLMKRSRFSTISSSDNPGGMFFTLVIDIVN